MNKLTLEIHGRAVTIQDTDDLTVRELLDMFHSAVLAQTYQEASWQEAIAYMALEYAENAEEEETFLRTLDRLRGTYNSSKDISSTVDTNSQGSLW